MASRMTPGDGAPLEPVRGWQKLWRTSFGVRRDGVRYDIDADLLDLDEKVRLFLDGRHVETRTSPARFPIPGATIEVAFSMVGLKRAHVVDASGGESAMSPNPGTLEHWRQSMDRSHPTASRVLSAASWAVLVLGLVTGVTELLDLAGPFIGLEGGAPFRFPEPVAGALGTLGIAAAIERALMLRHHWLLD